VVKRAEQGHAAATHCRYNDLMASETNKSNSSTRADSALAEFCKRLDGLPILLVAQAKLRIMSAVVRLGTVAGWFAEPVNAGGDRTGSKIAQIEDLLQQRSAF
jgi:hypothetical protein